MSDSPSTPSTPQPPSAVLLSTDLSCRCDRALDRAVLSAKEWQARLVALTVVEPTAASRLDMGHAAWQQARQAAQHTAERRLHADMARQDMPVAVRVEQGQVTDKLLEVAAQEAVGLVVTGVARSEALSRAVLGSTVDALVRRSLVPVLVVRERAWEPYARVVVATDFSPAARHALVKAARWYPQAELVLFHAHGAPYSLRAGIDPMQAQLAGFQQARQEADAFLQDAALPDDVRQRVRLELEHGDPAPLLHTRGQTHGHDLLVLATRGHSKLLHILLGSVAQRILEVAQNDVLLVPTPAAME